MTNEQWEKHKVKRILKKEMKRGTLFTYTDEHSVNRVNIYFTSTEIA